jgi:hypothetical protein
MQFPISYKPPYSQMCSALHIFPAWFLKEFERSQKETLCKMCPAYPTQPPLPHRRKQEIEAFPVPPSTTSGEKAQRGDRNLPTVHFSPAPQIPRSHCGPQGPPTSGGCPIDLRASALTQVQCARPWKCVFFNGSEFK